MYLNQWTKEIQGAGAYRYKFYLHGLRYHEANITVNTFLGIYEK